MVWYTLFKICCLRADPQDLPYSFGWFIAALVTYMIVNVITLFEYVTFARATAIAVLDVLLLVALVNVSLLLRNLSKRRYQALTALAGCGALLSSIAVFTEAVLPIKTLSTTIVVLFIAWLVLVYGHILRHALSVSWTKGIALTVVYLLISVTLNGGLLTERLPVED